MKENYGKLLITALILFIVVSVNGQHFLSTSGKVIVNENQDTILLRGMGLGGWMVQEGYMLQTAGFANPQHQIRATIEDLIGTTNTDLFYETWLNNHVQKADIDSLKSWGFNSVRLPMHYNLYTLPIEEEPVAGENTWLTRGFELTDSLISWCRQNEMYVILDLHAAPGGQGYDAGISDYDDTKPSLWESEENRDKMVALWKNIAERYVDEQWVAGYDLLNEPNWDLPGGTALKNLYKEITDSIRTVDTQHILFIEGNWFANDFTGLTPPWDDNMVYSPHKYWSFNNEETMQWVLDLRNTYDIPLYLGESGENSNVWFRDAIRLLEDLDIGWAWWPMKKIESVAGPLSVVKTDDYQTLLDYWSGNGTMPSAAFGTAALMEITEGLRIENCVFQKEVIDAMFRQVYSDETKPYNTQQIPGVVYATDYDMGVLGEAYYDIEVANYQVSTGSFTSWNNGWTYRNDGVDIELCMDNVNTNGYNVGWLDNEEWMQYDVEVNSTGVYEIHVRAASGESGGYMHFGIGDAAITPSVFVPETGDWQNWQNVVIPDVVLDANDEKLRLYVDEAGFNISSFEFIQTSTSTTSIPAMFVSARTIDESSIQMNCNKFIQDPLPSSPGGFEIFVDGSNVPISDIMLDVDNPRVINFTIDYFLRSSEEIKISYNGNAVDATDGTALNNFTLEDVENTLSSIYQIPGKIEAEGFSFQTGVVLEQTTDDGGGQNIGYLDPGDYLDYQIEVMSAGDYLIKYRTASLDATGGLELQIIDNLGTVTVVDAPTFAPTGGWQDWVTNTGIVTLPEGLYTMRIVITQSPFNLNWIEFLFPTAVNESIGDTLIAVDVFPNPVNNTLNLYANLKQPQGVVVELSNINSQIIYSKASPQISEVQEVIELDAHPDGFYLLTIRLDDGSIYSEKVVKIGR